MKKLDKQDIKRRDDIISRLHAAQEELEAAVAKYNEELRIRWADVEIAKDALNAVLDDARAYVADMKSQIDDFISEHDTKWAEGKKGQAYSTWSDEYEAAFLADAEVEQPDELLELDENYIETLEDLPTEVEE